MVTWLLIVCALLAGAGTAGAATLLPPPGKVFQGVGGGPISTETYQLAVGRHPAVYQEFVPWGQYLPAMFVDAANARARLMISISTAYGPHEMVTPAGIAAGGGDAWLIALNRAMFASRGVTYIRLMAEMDAYWNPYSAENANGSSRGPAHSTAAFRRAWKRVTLILRGGSLAHIDHELGRLGMPSLNATGDLPRPRVAMLWVPQVAGAPDVGGNAPKDYWPGKRWVDWVGTDFYAKFPNFSGLNAFYAAFPGEPFLFGEYALWGSDNPGFIDRLFDWVGSHPRTRMLVYNQGVNPSGPFRLSLYPKSARELRRRLAQSTFSAL